MNAVLAPSAFGLTSYSVAGAGFSLIVGVPDHAARAAIDLLSEAPTLSAAELSDYLGITTAQARLCIAYAWARFA